MEFILFIVGYVLVVWAWDWVKQNVFGAAPAGGESGSHQQEMAALEADLRLEHVDGEHKFDVYQVVLRGLFPLASPARLGVRAAILDVTEKMPDGRPLPKAVTCSLEWLQEAETICYRDCREFGTVEPNHGFREWVPVLRIIPETLTPPRRGQRTFDVWVYLYDLDQPFEVRAGVLRDGNALWLRRLNFSWTFETEGYEERAENRAKAEELIIAMAAAVAYADGSLADAEGNVIKRWASKRLDYSSGSGRAEQRGRLNRAISRAFRDGATGQLDLGELIEQLRRIGIPAACVEAVELCLDVMSADGVADREEMLKINRIAERLDVDMEHFEALRDKRVVGLTTSLSNSSDYHALLGIDPTWDRDRIRGHLNRLYSQWNSRAESLEDPDKRADAERMLETIAAARRSLLT